MKTWIALLLLLITPAAWAAEDAKAAPEKVTVELYDAKGGMIGEVKVEKSQLEKYTQERKAEGITVKPLVKSAPAPAASKP